MDLKRARNERGVPSKERELTGGLTRVMIATPSAPTSITALPLGVLPIALLCLNSSVSDPLRDATTACDL